eukprot:scaffold293_cov135-Cylindrotheca_fusiformis.AAC.3
MEDNLAFEKQVKQNQLYMPSFNDDVEGYDACQEGIDSVDSLQDLVTSYVPAFDLCVRAFCSSSLPPVYAQQKSIFIHTQQLEVLRPFHLGHGMPDRSEAEDLQPDFFDYMYTSDTKEADIPKRTLTHLLVDSSLREIPDNTLRTAHH